MRTLGYTFRIEGEFCERLEDLEDPAMETWELFETCDLHLEGKSNIVVMIPNYQEPCPEAQAEATRRAVVIVEWLWSLKRWEAVNASLRLYRGKEEPGEVVHNWELA